MRKAINGGFEFTDPLFTECKVYKSIAVRSDPMFSVAQEANEIVKNHIREKGFIVYGGEAIDPAVKSRGGSLYDESTIPDYDFYAPDSVQSAYALADILYAAGMESARAIAGIHFGTMRVDAGDNHFVADLSYCPVELFEAIPTITSAEGIKGVHPAYQRADMHRALSKPYLDPPGEAVFNRMAKDISRYNLMEEYFPWTELSEFGPAEQTLRAVLIPRRALTRPLTGFAASRVYQLVCSEGVNAPPVEAKTSPGGLTLDLPADIVERISTEIPSISRKWFADLLVDEHHEEGSPLVATGNVHGLLIPCVTVRVVGLVVRLACVQYVLWWLLGHFWASRAGRLDKNLGANYLAEYMKLISLVHSRGNEDPRLAPWVEEFYGDLNESTGARLNKLRAEHARNPRSGPAPPKPPTNYYPAKSKGKHPVWDITSFETLPH